MIWLYYILLLLLTVAGLFLVLLTLPGLWLITAAAGVYALLTHGIHLGFKSLLTLLILSLIGEVLEISAESSAEFSAESSAASSYPLSSASSASALAALSEHPSSKCSATKTPSTPSAWAGAPPKADFKE